MVAENGTGPACIQFPIAVAVVSAKILPSESASLIPKTASKYQFPGAEPVIVSGKLTTEFASGEVRVIGSAGAGVSTGFGTGLIGTEVSLLDRNNDEQEIRVRAEMMIRNFFICELVNVEIIIPHYCQLSM